MRPAVILSSRFPTPSVSRRALLGVLGGAGACGVAMSRALAAGDDVLTEALVLRDPDIPVAGNPKGDISIVEYFDFQCPYCRKIEPELQQLAKEDGQLRLVFKDWPILGSPSVYAARLALAARYQEKYIEAHEALIGMTSRLTEAGARDVLAKAGIDVDRAVRDLDARGKEVDAVLARNDEQAKAFSFRGTPSFIVGKFRVPGILSKENFKLAIADARAAAKARSQPPK